MSAAARPSVEVSPTPEALTIAAAERFVAAAGTAVAARGRFAVALSGGSTPRALYTTLATPAYAARVPWARAQLFWGDERCVGPLDAASNYRMACEALLDHVPVPAENVHRIRGEDAPPSAAHAYERELGALLGASGAGGIAPASASASAPERIPAPRFDLVLLGLGANGHTASLFPGLRAVREATRWVMAEHVESEGMWRVTLTPAVLNGAAEVLFLVSGSAKAAILRRVLYGARDIDELPAQVIAPREGRLRWMVDAAAAAALPAT